MSLFKPKTPAGTFVFLALLCLILTHASDAFCQGQPASFSGLVDLSKGASTPSALSRPRAPRQPLPRPWKIGITVTALLVGATLLGISVRAWRAANLFDRQYRFPTVGIVPLRLGADKAGGVMATIGSSDRAGPTGAESSPEDS